MKQINKYTQIYVNSINSHHTVKYFESQVMWAQ